MTRPVDTERSLPEGYVLDPLALSAETRGRFGMLLITAFVMTWSLASFVVPADLSYSVSSMGVEAPILGNQGTVASLEDLGLDEFLEALSENLEAQEQLRRHAWQWIASAILIGAFFLLYGFFKRHSVGRTVRRHSTRRLETREAPALAAELEMLAHRAGLEESPEWHLKPGNLDGLAFGSANRPILAVGGEASRLERGWGDLHRAVVLHELGHVVNRDTTSREGVKAAWTALGMLSCLTAVVLVSRGDSWAELGTLTVRLLVATALGISLWAGLVRTREYFADWRVARWGFGAALRRRLSLEQAFVSSDCRNPDGKSKRPSGTAAHRVLRGLLLSLHPSNKDRIRTLDDPHRLFRVSLSLAAATGWLLSMTIGFLGLGLFQTGTVVLGSVMTFSLLLFGAVPSLLVAAALLSLLVGALLPISYWVVNALGIQMLRDGTADISEGGTRGWGYRRHFRTALAFAVGAEMGFWITPIGITGWLEPAWMILWLSVFTILAWIWMIQSRALGRLVLGAFPSSTSATILERKLRWLLTALLLPLFLPAMAGRASLGAATALLRTETPLFLGEPPSVFIDFSIITSLLLLTLALLASSILGGFAFFFIRFRLVNRCLKCSGCGEPWGSRQTVGLSCPGCGRPRAAWLYCVEGPAEISDLGAGSRP